MMSIEFIKSKKVPKAVGPYSHGTKGNGLIITSGQIPEDPKTGEMIMEIKAATKLVLENLLSVIEAGGGRKETVMKVDVFLKDLNDFGAFMKPISNSLAAINPPAYWYRRAIWQKTPSWKRR